METARAVTIGSLMTALAIALAGCVVERHHSTAPGPGYTTSGGDTSSAAPSYYIDTNAVVALSTAPGDGAAVLVSYQSGGRWNVQTLCDSNRTGLACDFEVYAQALNSGISGLVGEGLTAGDVVQYQGSDTALLYSQTGYEVDGMWFDTSPGATVQFTAYLGGALCPGYLFWNSNGGTIDPAYSVDPVQLTPTSY